MPITIVTTAGAADANSYATLVEATAFNAGRPQSSAWANADDDTRTAALLWACILLDSDFVWTGAATDKDVQALCWPRVTMQNRNGGAIASDVIPQALKNAQSEWARQLIVNDLTSTNDALKQSLSHIKAGPVELTFSIPNSNTLDLRRADLQLRNPEFAWLSKSVPDVVPQILIPSWYERDALGQPFVFESSR